MANPYRVQFTITDPDGVEMSFDYAADDVQMHRTSDRYTVRTAATTRVKVQDDLQLNLTGIRLANFTHPVA